MYNKTVLDNGIKILTEQIDEFKSASIGIWVNTGPKNENEKNLGISHFIEHMLFKGTSKYTACDIAEIMDSVGGHLNAFTEKEETCFYTKVMDQHIPLAIDILSDMFLNSIFSPTEIDRERSVILEEIRMYEDTPDDVIFEEFNKTLWDNHPLACPTLGNIDTVTGFVRGDFLNYMADFYMPDKITIAAAGHFKHENIVDMVRKNFESLKGRAKVVEKRQPEFFQRNKVRYRDCEQAYICLGGRGISHVDERKYVFIILDTILGGSMSSRLFQEIREKRGLVYTVSTFANSYIDTAQFGVYACTSPENLPEVVRLTHEVLDDVKEKGITQKELERAKEHIKGGISLGLESTANRMIRLNKSELYYGRLVPIEEVIEKVDRVTLEDVAKLAKELLERKNYATAILGPVEVKDVAELLGGE